MAVEILVDALIDIVNRNIIAKTNVTSNISTGDVIVNVENSFQFKPNQEVVLIDWTYNVEGSAHYNVFEYAKIQSVNNTTSITLESPAVGNWLTSDNTFVQKTIGHSPLYENNVLYGDRQVIPTDQVAIAIEGASLSNEWMYIQGGLSEEYRMKVIIYAKDIKFEDGRRVLDRYSDAVYQLLNDNIHLDVNNVETPLTEDYQGLTLSPSFQYQMQDNKNATHWFNVKSVDWVSSPGNIILTIDNPQVVDITMADFGLCRRWHEYIYDARVDGVTYGQVSKGSAFLRAAELSWFGKRINEHRFPQRSNRVNTTKS